MNRESPRLPARQGIKKFKTLLIVVSLVFMATACNKYSNVAINGQQLSVQIAESSQAQAQGLSGRSSLGANEGMYFEFHQPGRYSFWMKDMKFALDFIWVKDGKVVEITPNVQAEPNVPQALLRVYSPQELVDANIEVNAGWAKKNKIKVGDEVDRTPLDKSSFNAYNFKLP